MNTHLNEQFLLDQIGGRVISTVKLSNANRNVHSAEFETTIFSTSRNRFIESGPFYWKTEEEARRMHDFIKDHEQQHDDWQLFYLGAHY